HPTPHHLRTDEPPHPRPHLRRFAAYALTTDPHDRILLCKIAPGYPGADTWHLPGGGVDHGETPHTALQRELHEETGQHGHISDLFAITSHYRTNQTGPESDHTDIHAIWLLYHLHVPHPTTPHVTETTGSTSTTAWYHRTDLAHLPLSATAHHALTL
ncbi:NUDIX hydrolase, partial [Salinactinospora qingdaonensis]|uniref:NUDIX hydrolase n=1 Tax=Salinactinospora qingdaonensis TaxID=702744 RepID=UPI0031EBB3B8